MESCRPDYPRPGSVERGLDLLFPPLCVGCRRVGRWICARCWTQVGWLTAGDDRSTPPGTLRGLLAVAEFDGLAREAVHALKYEGRHAIAGMMGRMMAERARQVPSDFVVPVPLHPKRRRERGYDQAALLARSVARAVGSEYRPDLLRRARHTPQQTTLDRAARRENVRGAFDARSILHGESVLLVDDVFTTGATMEEAAGAVTTAGGGTVIGLVFARAGSGEHVVPDAPTGAIQWRSI